MYKTPFAAQVDLEGNEIQITTPGGAISYSLHQHYALIDIVRGISYAMMTSTSMPAELQQPALERHHEAPGLRALAAEIARLQVESDRIRNDGGTSADLPVHKELENLKTAFAIITGTAYDGSSHAESGSETDCVTTEGEKGEAAPCPTDPSYFGMCVYKAQLELLMNAFEAFADEEEVTHFTIVQQVIDAYSEIQEALYGVPKSGATSQKSTTKPEGECDDC